MTDQNPKPVRVPLEEAEFKVLKHFAEIMLGLDVPNGANAAQLRSKIKAAMPDCKDIPLPPAPPPPVVAAPPQPTAPATPATVPAVEGENPEVRPAAISRPASAALMHPSQDPKVKLRVSKTDDKRRSRDVTVSVNGDVYRMQRGVPIEVPYRVFLALENALERQAVETDQINPTTLQPIMSWEEVRSYPFDVISMPSDEDIAAWELASGAGFKNAA